MSAAGRFFVTPHAVDRYRERTGQRHLSYEQALGAVIQLSERARRVKPWGRGLTLYRGPKPHRLRLLVNEAARPLPALITIYGGHDR